MRPEATNTIDKAKQLLCQENVNSCPPGILADEIAFIGETQGRIGMEKDARENFDRALSLANGVKDVPFAIAVRSIVSVIAMQAQSGDVSNALQNAKTIKNDYGNRWEALQIIAEVQAKLGKASDSIRTADIIGDDVTRALAFVKLIPNLPN